MPDNRWYRFEDEKKEKIVGDAACEQPPHPGKGSMEQLPESDPRVQEYLGPIWARNKIQSILIESPEDLIGAQRICSGIPKFAYRGESDFSLPLTTRIEKNRDKTILTEIGVRQYEQRILLEARRRAQYYVADRPEVDDTLGWLALLRHNGVPTRMLDVTWSLFIAAYFAVNDQSSTDACVWAFNQSVISLGLHTTIFQNRDSLFVSKNSGAFIDGYQPPTSPYVEPEEKVITFSDVMSSGGPNINLLFELALQEALFIEGVILVEPHWLSRRMDAQQGAFLVPLKLQTGFMSNLYASGGISNGAENEPKTVSQVLSEYRAKHAIWKNSAIIKFKIKASIKKELTKFLESVNIRRLVLFPDSEGFFGHLSDIIPSSQVFGKDQ